MTDPLDDRRARALDAVRSALARLLKDDTRRLANVGMMTSLVDDLAMDSFLFVDLTLTLEEELGIERFPMRRWADAQTAGGGRFSIGSLVDLCVDVMEPSPEARSPVA